MLTRFGAALLPRLALQFTIDQQEVARSCRGCRGCRADADAAGAGRLVGLPERGDGRGQTIAALFLGLLGRLDLSGHLPRLSEDQRAAGTRSGHGASPAARPDQFAAAAVVAWPAGLG
jgi:hypothetical protein